MKKKHQFNDDLPLSLKSTSKTICISFILEIQDFAEKILGLIINNYRLKTRKNKNYRFTNNPDKAIQRIRLIGSNHPRRKEFGKNFLFIIKDYFFYFLKKDKQKLKNRNCKIYLIKKNISRKESDKIIFCGDSHVEFFSRFSIRYKRNKVCSPLSMWLGPLTLIGFSQDSKLQKTVIEAATKLIDNKRRTKILFSLGSIDIRTTIGFLLCSKSISSEDEAIDLVINAFISLYESVFPKFQKEGIYKVGLMSIPPASSVKGIDHISCDPRTALKYQKENDLTIFGSQIYRARWTKKINKIFSSIAKEKGWFFLNNSNLYESITFNNRFHLDKKYSYDDHHITYSKIYQDIFNNLNIR